MFGNEVILRSTDSLIDIPTPTAANATDVCVSERLFVLQCRLAVFNVTFVHSVESRNLQRTPDQLLKTRQCVFTVAKGISNSLSLSVGLDWM